MDYRNPVLVLFGMLSAVGLVPLNREFHAIWLHALIAFILLVTAIAVYRIQE
ncbi:hypothetical protein [uncultured Marinobacter sp.]|uniref:hypothetical protein n=1 Tax=uncultured Marinobacter sp. TaxID=187379 RepID=UPI0026350FB6|nr:hypothetical protein [uncultured Marinobacter sp.]